MSAGDLLGPDLPAEILLADHGRYLATRYAEVPPTSLAGSYSLVAEQKEARVAKTLRLRRGPLGDPENSRLMPQSDFSYAHGIAAGQTLDFLLLDFASNARVELALYYNTGTFRRHGENGKVGDGWDFAFLRSLPPVEVNKQGWAYHSIVIPTGLPDTRNESYPDFCVVADPRLKEPYCQPGFEATFSLRE